MDAIEFEERVPDSRLRYLCVEEFLSTAVSAESLHSAFQIGLIDFLVNRSGCTHDDLVSNLKADSSGLAFLIELLKAGNVLSRTEADGSIELTSGFLAALEFRDILEAKLVFANLAAQDFIHGFTTLIEDSGQFMQQSRILELFDYERCIEPTAENLQHTRRWMQLTTALTRYEAPVCDHVHNFSGYRRLLDIGGNSGEFALQLCRRNPQLHAEVFDLPVVCEIGRGHVSGAPESSRISFRSGNARTDKLPGGFDIVTIKSMLHDWPVAQTQEFLERAFDALQPGGRVLIFERGPIQPTEQSNPYSLLPMFIFFRSFRSPKIYRKQLTDTGFSDITVQHFDLEMPFFIVTGQRLS